MKINECKLDILGRAKAEAGEMYFYGCVQSLRRSKDYIYRLLIMPYEKKRKFLSLPHVRWEMNPYFSRDHWFKYFIKEFSKVKKGENEKVSG